MKNHAATGAKLSKDMALTGKSKNWLKIYNSGGGPTTKKIMPPGKT